MEFDTRSGDHFNSASLIFPMDLNSVGAPNETPIIWPAQPPWILSRSSSRERCRVSALAESAQQATHSASTTKSWWMGRERPRALNGAGWSIRLGSSSFISRNGEFLNDYIRTRERTRHCRRGNTGFRAHFPDG